MPDAPEVFNSRKGFARDTTMRPGDQVVLLLLFVAALHANAAEYKCKDADGQWSVTACADVAEPPPPPRGDIAKHGKDGQIWVPERFATTEEAYDCVDAWRSNLTDPLSARAEGSRLIMYNGKERHLIVEGRARNVLGAFEVHYFICLISEDGVVDRHIKDLVFRADEITRKPFRFDDFYPTTKPK